MVGEVTPFYRDDWLTVYHGDSREVMAALPEESVHCVVTSPPLEPYWGLRDYGTPGQLGLEPTPEEYVANLVAVFREVRRVLRKDGTVWLNLGDSYATGAGSYRNPGSDVAPIEHGGKQAYTRDYARAQPNRMPLAGLKPKDRVMIPARVALALQADGWWLRDEIVWAKPNPMPSSVQDRTTPAHEMVYLLTKSARYWYDADAIKEPLAASSVQRINQASFDSQAGGPKDSANGTNPNQSARKALENFARPRRKPAGWNVDHVQSNLIGRYKHDSAIRPHSQAVASPNRVFGDDEAMERMVDGGRNKRSVWTVPSQAYPEAHFATFPEALIEPMILAGCPEGGTVLDPFAGSGTTGLVAQRLSRRAVLIDLSQDYLDQLMRRNADIPLGLGA